MRDHNKIVAVVIVIVVGISAFHNVHDAVKRFPQAPSAELEGNGQCQFGNEEKHHCLRVCIDWLFIY
jgi:hypothetical protein